MVFASPIFLFLFLPVTLLLYWAAPGRFKNALLLTASLLFYAWGEPWYVLLMMFSIAANFYLARVMESRRTSGGAKAVLIWVIALNLGMLAVFKYADFAISAVSGAFRANLPGVKLALPIGISFYTFQILSYVIDVYRGEVGPQRSLINFGAYVTMFPQLIAGPIVRYSDIASQLENRRFSIDSMAAGARRFCAGLAKKVLIANIAAELADTVFSLPPASLGWSAAWLGAIAYAVQIYFDFSGYSDMALGLGKLLGFEFNENFDYPYISTSIREFWRRWHISLSSWFRDYLYIPLGGNRRGTGRTYLNLVIVFALCGLWHGASWTFVVWGLYHGLFLVLERQGFMQRLLKWLPKGISGVYALMVVLIGWVIFRADTFADAWGYLSAMFSAGGATGATVLLTKRTLLALACGIVSSAPILPWLKRTGFGKSIAFDAVSSAAALAALALCMIMLAGGTYNPFIYFRF